MPPHPPPCHGKEVLIEGECLPGPDLFRVFKTGDNFTFELKGVSEELLPHLEKSAGNKAEIKVEKADPGLEVLITSVPRGEASELVRRLQPNAPPKLPD